MTMKPDPIDIQVGSRLRQRRVLLGMTQENLGTALDLSFQQIQKYERGINRISAGRLYQLSQILNVSVGYFFEGPTHKGAARTSEAAPGARQPGSQTKRETLELARAFSQISDAAVRKRLLQIAKSMAKFSPSD